ncbi:MAG: hypothetical protein HOH66_18075 [Rhodospirillaceae bacterium]|nr:hypothetical protein [Rhodospirillaceae bacterium]MBT6119774.1 hypothetical protein [Rhodospirillaceae bacterium]
MPAQPPAPPPPSGRDWWPFAESESGPALPPRLWAPTLILSVALVLAVVAVL